MLKVISMLPEAPDPIFKKEEEAKSKMRLFTSKYLQDNILKYV